MKFNFCYVCPKVSVTTTNFIHSKFSDDQSIIPSWDVCTTLLSNLFSKFLEGNTKSVLLSTG